MKPRNDELNAHGPRFERGVPVFFRIMLLPTRIIRIVCIKGVSNDKTRLYCRHVGKARISNFAQRLQQERDREELGPPILLFGRVYQYR